MRRGGKSIEQRFNEYAMPEPNSGCWLWLGAIESDASPYGRISIERDGVRRSVKAHRLAFELFRGPIPDGHHVCHRCDNRNCVNPDHLFTGPASANIRDAVRKGRLNPHVRKLSFEEAEQIRRMYRYRTPGRTAPALGRLFGVTAGAINNVLTGRSYRASTFAESPQ